MVDSNEEGIETVFAASKTEHLPFLRDTLSPQANQHTENVAIHEQLRLSRKPRPSRTIS